MLRPKPTASRGEHTTGVEGQSGCCGGPAPAEVEACCAKDAEAKAQGSDGCGCSEGAARPDEKATQNTTCCGTAA